MTRSYRPWSIGVCLGLLLTGCVAQQAPGQIGPKAGGGAAIGAAAGGLLGALAGRGNPLAIAGGVLLGAGAGFLAGDSLDANDRQWHQATVRQALHDPQPQGRVYAWQNPQTGHAGRVTVSRDDGYCREYQQTILVGNREALAYGRACRQPDGSWDIR